MTDQEVIVELTKENYTLKNELKVLQSDRVKARQSISRLTCIGGPLNDNCLQFNDEQVRYLYRLYNEIMAYVDEYDDE